MAALLSSNNIRILTQKVLLFTVVFASVAVAAELAVPLLLNFAVHDFPTVWTALTSWFKPPYLYLLINIIILTISATSYFHQHDDQENQPQPLVIPTPSNFLQVPTQQSFGVFDSVPRFSEEAQPSIVGLEMMPMSTSCHPPQQILNFPPMPESSLISPGKEKPVVDSRFAQRKRIKTGPDGARDRNVATEVAAEDDGYTDGRRQLPLTKHLRKSETFENHRHSHVYGREETQTVTGIKKKKVLKKSATLKDRTNYDDKNHRPPSQPSSVILSPESEGGRWKDGSLNNDDLNRRVEEFIKKFNDEMRLQRQASVKQYRALTNREKK